jgi:hypothetical protein
MSFLNVNVKIMRAGFFTSILLQVFMMDYAENRGIYYHEQV